MEYFTVKISAQALSPHSKRAPGLNPGWDFSVWSLRVLLMYVWVLSGYSNFLPGVVPWGVANHSEGKLSAVGHRKENSPVAFDSYLYQYLWPELSSQ